MAHRQHLFSLKFGHSIKASCSEHLMSRKVLLADLLAGITVGIIAIPLSMALAIASGVPPQYGLYSAIIAGILAASIGGSRYSVTGPTAAFVVILFPIVQNYGLTGLLIATVLGGVFQVLFALMKLGRLIEYIPGTVTLGFTSGIAVVIATLQLKDFLGLKDLSLPDSYLEKVTLLIKSSPSFSPETLTTGLITLLIMLVWPRMKVAIPAHLPAVIVGTLVALVLNDGGTVVATINSTFSYTLADGSAGQGIPDTLPTFQFPWLRTSLNGESLVFDFITVRALISAGFAIALLGAIESLLCAVVLDGMTGKRHSANSELLGQGIANIVAPFFGGITATAAIARSAANYKAGAKTPMSVIIHSITVFVSILFLSKYLGYVPMASMAALLFMVAWNMSELPKAIQLLKNSHSEDIFVFAVCFLLTVFFDMVLAITVGTVLASLLFMRTMASMTRIQDTTEKNARSTGVTNTDYKVVKINGPLFYAAADRVFTEISFSYSDLKGIVLDLGNVSFMDSGGLSAFQQFVFNCAKDNTHVYVANIQFQVLKTLAKSGFNPEENGCSFYSALDEALDKQRENK